MKYWVQFLVRSKTNPGELVDALGSDGTQALDGRLSSLNLAREATRRAQRLEHIKKFDGFRIVSGVRFYEERRRGPLHLLTYPIQTD